MTAPTLPSEPGRRRPWAWAAGAVAAGIAGWIGNCQFRDEAGQRLDGGIAHEFFDYALHRDGDLDRGQLR